MQRQVLFEPNIQRLTAVLTGFQTPEVHCLLLPKLQRLTIEFDGDLVLNQKMESIMAGAGNKAWAGYKVYEQNSSALWPGIRECINASQNGKYLGICRLTFRQRCYYYSNEPEKFEGFNSYSEKLDKVFGVKGKTRKITHLKYAPRYDEYVWGARKGPGLKCVNGERDEGKMRERKRRKRS